MIQIEKNLYVEEVSPLPKRCVECQEEKKEEDCYNCDYALERWKLLKI